MTVYVYTTRTSTFKKYINLRVPFLFDNGRVQSPWITGILRFIVLCFIALHRSVFYKLKAKPFPSKKIIACFIVVVWNRSCNISEVCLQFIWNLLNLLITIDLLTAKHILPGQFLRDSSSTPHHKVDFSTALILDIVTCPEASSPPSRQSSGGDGYCPVYQDLPSPKTCSLFR